MHRRYQNLFNAECPVCREGKSKGRSRRLFYFPNKNYLYCHNCSKHWNPFEWIREVTNLSVPEIIKRNNEKINSSTTFVPNNEPAKHKQEVLSDLPENSIDITDPVQIEFYKDNKVVTDCVDYCISRRLFTSTNRCKKFYVSLDDRFHKNRLIIPFTKDNKVVCYQTRALYKEQTPKYKTKIGDKSLFGIDNITEEIPYIFIFEGPIDSMFVKNGVAMASLTPTDIQREQLNKMIGYKHIYVFDNDKNNKQTAARIIKTINKGNTVFVWPSEFKKFKDINEVCVALKQDEFPWKFIVKNSFSGPQAVLKFKTTNAYIL